MASQKNRSTKNKQLRLNAQYSEHTCNDSWLLLNKTQKKKYRTKRTSSQLVSPEHGAGMHDEPLRTSTWEATSLPVGAYSYFKKCSQTKKPRPKGNMGFL